ncbi:M24 family metallopeptidase [Chromobacterium sinusclupearum]|nr:Xaa-Pro peptidase family protein [Chromobacterium sinusclupearum]
MIYDSTHFEEMARRDHALRQQLREAGIRHYLALSTDSLYYLSGLSFEPLERPFFLLLEVESGRRHLLVPQLEFAHLQSAWGVEWPDIHSYREYPAPKGEDWQARLLPLLPPDFAFDANAPWQLATVLQELGGRACAALDRVRLVKSDWEIARLERAAAYAAEGVNRLLARAYDGMSVAEGYALGPRLLRAIIQHEQHFDPLCTKVLLAPWPAPLSAQPHAIPRLGQRLEGGPHVVICVVRLDGYTAECERTFFTRPPTAEAQDRFKLMCRARSLAESLLRPSAPCAVIDQAVNRFLSEQGFADWHIRLHRTGHGLGLSNHEGPWLAEGSDDVLRAGMVVSIEPGLYLDKEGGYRHSDTYVITANGARCLTLDAPTSLKALTLQAPRPLSRAQGYFVRKAVSA